MKLLRDLGFERYRCLGPDIALRFLEGSGYALPDSYLEFLCFRHAAKMLLTFRFVRADGQEWEGCVSEFNNIAPNGDRLENIENQIIRPAKASGRVFFPIASDPGGNWLCLELSKPGVPVVDLDQGTGLISEVAADFEAFVAALYRRDET